MDNSNITGTFYIFYDSVIIWISTWKKQVWHSWSRCNNICLARLEQMQQYVFVWLLCQIPYMLTKAIHIPLHPLHRFFLYIYTFCFLQRFRVFFGTVCVDSDYFCDSLHAEIQIIFGAVCGDSDYFGTVCGDSNYVRHSVWRFNLFLGQCT